MNTSKFKDLFWETFLEYQRTERKSSVTTFARYLTRINSFGVAFSQPLVSGWLNGDFSPSEKYAPALAEIMGDYIYDILNIPRPDYDLQAITKVWNFISEESRRAIREQAEAYAAGRKNKNENDRQILESPI